MKKVIGIMIVVVLMGVLLTAATPAPGPIQTLRGTLHWQPGLACGSNYFVALQTMDNVYVTGKFGQAFSSVMSAGSLNGCQIQATGNYFLGGRCQYFVVDQYQLVCPTKP